MTGTTMPALGAGNIESRNAVAETPQAQLAATEVEGYYVDIPQDQLRAVIATSEEKVGEAATNSGSIERVLDGDFSTFWHSKWQNGEDPALHSFVIASASEEVLEDVGRITLGTRRSSSGSGRAKDVDVYVSADPQACGLTDSAWELIEHRDIPATDKNDQNFTFASRSIACVKVTINKGWDGKVEKIGGEPQITDPTEPSQPTDPTTAPTTAPTSAPTTAPTSAPTSAPTQPAEPSVDVPSGVFRKGGVNRFGTAQAVAEGVFKPGEVRLAVVANGYAYADALTSSALAGSVGGPVLLSDPQKLNWEARSALQNPKPASVMIAGGKGAVSLEVENQVKKIVQ